MLMSVAETLMLVPAATRLYIPPATTPHSHGGSGRNGGELPVNSEGGGRSCPEFLNDLTFSRS